MLWEWYRELLRLRQETAALRLPYNRKLRVYSFPDSRTLAAVRWDDEDEVLVGQNFADRLAEVRVPLRGGT